MKHVYILSIVASSNLQAATLTSTLFLFFSFTFPSLRDNAWSWKSITFANNCWHLLPLSWRALLSPKFAFLGKPTHVYLLLQHQGFVENLTIEYSNEHIMAYIVAYWMELCNKNKIKLGILMWRCNTLSNASPMEKLHHISNYLISPRLHMSKIALWTIMAIDPHIFSTIEFCSSSSKPSRPNKPSRTYKTPPMSYCIFGN
jgi:hypothetical protein